MKGILRPLVVESGIVSLILALAAGCRTLDPYARLAAALSKPIDTPSSRVAVLPFRNLSTATFPTGDVVAERLIASLERNSRFRLVERTLLQEILDEKKLGLAGMTDHQTTQEFGKLAGADQLIVGTVWDLGDDRLEVNARLIDVRSSDVLASARGVVPLASVGEAGAPARSSRQRRIWTHGTRRDFLRGTWVGWGAEVSGNNEAKVTLAEAGGRVHVFQRFGSTLPDASFGMGAVAWNERIYLAGGSHGVQGSREVFSAPVSDEGALGPWTLHKPLPEGVLKGALTAWNGRLYYSGGATWHARTLPDRLNDRVWMASVLEDGSVGHWSPVLSLPMGVMGHSMVAWDGHLFVIGGTSTGGCNEKVLAASILPSGHLAGWSIVAQSPALAATIFHGGLFLAGSNCGRASSAVQRSSIDPIFDTNGWIPGNTRLPVEISGHGVVALNDSIYIVGGTQLEDSLLVKASTMIYSADFVSRHEGTEWRTEGLQIPLTQAIAGTSLAAWSHWIYLFGGGHPNDKIESYGNGIHAIGLGRGPRVSKGYYFNSFDLRRRFNRVRFGWDQGGAGMISLYIRVASEDGPYSGWRRIVSGDSVEHVRFIEYRAELMRAPYQGGPELRKVWVGVLE